MVPITQDSKKILTMLLLNLPNNFIIATAPIPYITQNGPNRKLCLLSTTPFVIIPNPVSKMHPIKL